MLARKFCLALTALAIVPGVTFVTGTLVLTDTLNGTFDTLIGTAYQHVNFQIRGTAAFNTDTAAAAYATADRKAIPESVATAVRRLRGVPYMESACCWVAFPGASPSPASDVRNPSTTWLERRWPA